MQTTMQLNISTRAQVRLTRSAGPSLPLQRLRRSTVVRAEEDDKPVKAGEIDASVGSAKVRGPDWQVSSAHAAHWPCRTAG